MPNDQISATNQTRTCDSINATDVLEFLGAQRTLMKCWLRTDDLAMKTEIAQALLKTYDLAEVLQNCATNLHSR